MVARFATTKLCDGRPLHIATYPWGHPACVAQRGPRCDLLCAQAGNIQLHRCVARRLARRSTVGAKAWADGHIAELKRSPNHLEVSSEFRSLCQSQLRLVSEVLQLADNQGTEAQSLRITLYKRDALSLNTGHLQLCQFASLTSPGPGSDEYQQALDRTLSLGNVGDAPAHGAEEALTQAQLVDLPHSGGLVLPLAAHGFLVGLLVVEGYSTQASLPSSGTIASGPRVLSLRQRDLVAVAGQVLASACAMELHSALESAQAKMHNQQVVGLVKEARGPLVALRTLGSILVPRLQQAQGRAIDRDMVQGMLTQGDRLQEVVQQLEAAIQPVDKPRQLKMLTQYEGSHVNNANHQQLQDLKRPMLPLSQHSALQKFIKE